MPVKFLFHDRFFFFIKLIIKQENFYVESLSWIKSTRTRGPLPGRARWVSNPTVTSPASSPFLKWNWKRQKKRQNGSLISIRFWSIWPIQHTCTTGRILSSPFFFNLKNLIWKWPICRTDFQGAKMSPVNLDVCAEGHICLANVYLGEFDAHILHAL